MLDIKNKKLICDNCLTDSNRLFPSQLIETNRGTVNDEWITKVKNQDICRKCVLKQD